MRDSAVASYAKPPTPTAKPSALTPKTAGAQGTPAGPPAPKKPWQLLTPGEPFDLATAPAGATVRDQVCGCAPVSQPVMPAGRTALHARFWPLWRFRNIQQLRWSDSREELTPNLTYLLLCFRFLPRP